MDNDLTFDALNDAIQNNGRGTGLDSIDKRIAVLFTFTCSFESYVFGSTGLLAVACRVEIMEIPQRMLLSTMLWMFSSVISSRSTRDILSATSHVNSGAV